MSPSFERTILITGGTAGLGYHAALAIAAARPTHLVIVSSRTDPNHAADTISKTLNQSNVRFLPLDLSGQDNVRAFAAQWKTNRFPPIEILLLNAGMQFPGAVQYTTDGLESSFGINHVGSALLFFLLRPFLSDAARIVLTASGAHDPVQKTGLPDATYTSAEALAHPSPKSAAEPGRKRYTQSKLANVLWGYALQRRVEKLGKQWSVVSFDPGMMPGTGLVREASPVVQFLWENVVTRMIPLIRCLFLANTHTPAASGGNLAWVAIDAEARGMSGVYFEERRVIKSSVDSYDEEKQEDLWTWTVENLARDDEERKMFDIVE